MRPWEPLQSLNSLGVTEISELSKFSKSYISQVKHGKCPPSKKLLEVLKNHHRRIQTEHDYFTAFLRSRKAMHVSPGTEQFYRIKLGRFLSEVNADKATRQDIETFLLQFDNPGNRHAYYRAIRTFYNWREETLDLPSLALHLGHDSLLRVFRCRIVSVPCSKSMSLTLRARASETRQPKRNKSLISNLSRRQLATRSIISISAGSR